MERVDTPDCFSHISTSWKVSFANGWGKYLRPKNRNPNTTRQPKIKTSKTIAEKILSTVYSVDSHRIDGVRLRTL